MTETLRNLPFKLPGIGSLAQRASGEGDSASDDKQNEQRRELIRVNSRLVITQQILADNQTLLEDVSKTDESAANVLRSLSEKTEIEAFTSKDKDNLSISSEIPSRFLTRR